jgi:hypothetical protein
MPLKFVENNSIQIQADAVVITANGPSALGSMTGRQEENSCLSVRKSVRVLSVRLVLHRYFIYPVGI